MIEIKNLSKSYSSKTSKAVIGIQNISLTFANSGMVFIVGKSGSGKSTLLNLLGGLDTPDTGDIILNGQLLNAFSQETLDCYRNSYVGFIFQDCYLLPKLTVKENILLSNILQDKPINDDIFNELLKDLDISEVKTRKISQLSGGQKQRVCIARALIKEPKILLADEPTGALDISNSTQVYDLLKKISLNRLVIVVSHDYNQALKYGDRIIELADGNIYSDITKNSEMEIAKLNELRENEIQKHFQKTNITETLIEDSPINSFFIKPSEAFKMGFNNLMKGKVKAFITILLTSITMMLLGVSINIQSFSFANSFINSMANENISSLSVRHSYVEENDYGIMERHSENFTIEMLEELDGKYPDYLLPNYYFIKAFSFVKKTENNRYTPKINGYLQFKESINAESLDKYLNSKLLYGEYPKVNDECVEILISDYLCDFILAGGIRGEMFIEPEDLLGYYFNTSISDSDLIPVRNKIVGIYKTSYSETLFNRSNVSPNELFELIKNNRLTRAKINYIVTMSSFAISLKDELPKQYNKSLYFIGLDQYTANGDNSTHVSFFFDINYLEAAILFLDDTLTFEGIKYVPGYDENTLLKEDEIIISYKAYYKLFENYSSRDTVNLEFADFSVVEDQEIAIKDSFDNHYTRLFKIVGYSDDPMNNDVLLTTNNKELLDDIQIHSYGWTSNVYFPFKSNNESKNFINELEKIDIIPANYIAYNLNTVDTMFTIFSSVTIWLIIILILLVLVLFFTLFSNNIKNSQEEIGILRGIGSRGKDIAKIYFCEAIILGIINVIVSIILVIFSTSLINTLFTKNFQYKLEIVTLSPWSLIVVTIVSLLTLTISVSLPLSKLIKSRPIETIRQSKE
jgi:ABC-type lipoprotein export system ATPase subunit/ABC-type lipoprotein release transport system permease subunit